MARKTFRKDRLTEDVLTLSRRRFAELYERFDNVVVSFSGGKDSTVCLHLALEAAAHYKRLPLDCYFWDEEAIHPETIEYVQRVEARDDVRLRWLCVPIQHRNACSRKVPYWYPWNPDERHLWVRPMPEGAITMLPGFRWTHDGIQKIGARKKADHGLGVPDLAAYVYGKERGTIADVRGIRADESVRRYRSVAQQLKDNWIGLPRAGYSYATSPIYDWSVLDVWVAPRTFGWDYNRTYDIFALTGLSLNAQRVCPPYGEEPLGSLYLYATCWPELWHKMIARVPGAATAGRYARTELYGFGKFDRPPGLTWREWAFRQLGLYPPALRAVIADNIAGHVRMHKKKTNRPLDDVQDDPLTGLSWRFIAMAINRGDLKDRRGGMLNNRAVNARAKRKLTIEEVMDADRGVRY